MYKAIFLLLVTSYISMCTKEVSLIENNESINDVTITTRSASMEDLIGSWYLFRQDIDLGDPTFYDLSDEIGFTINEDLSMEGTDGCVRIEGNFVYEEDTGSDFFLVLENYMRDSIDCENGIDPGSTLYQFVEGATLYSAFYEDDEGMVLTMEFYPGFTMHFRNATLGVQDFQEATLSLYPNPTQDIISINTDIQNITDIEIFDLLGKSVFTTKDVSTNVIDVSYFNAGVYFMKLSTPSNSVVSKFIKR